MYHLLLMLLLSQKEIRFDIGNFESLTACMDQGRQYALELKESPGMEVTVVCDRIKTEKEKLNVN